MDGPFGVVSAAEFIGILLFAVYVIWAVYSYVLRTLHHVGDLSSFKEQRYVILHDYALSAETECISIFSADISLSL